MDYRINYGECTTPFLNLQAIERKYNAKYIGDFCLKVISGGWSTSPAAIFWQEKPPVEGYSNYFGIIARDEGVYITSGASAFSEPIEGIVSEDGEVVYSRFRHDFRSLSDGSGSIDGGRDYTKVCGDSVIPKSVLLKIEGPKLVVIEETSTTS